MSIFRVEKNNNYTVISNYHLRDTNLSLKTIGLLSLILSLPETWDYSQAGLAAICKDGEDSIRSGLKELEQYGYLVRERERDENGRMRGIVYHIYEIPRKRRESSVDKNSTCCLRQKIKSPTCTDPALDSPILENPNLVNSTLDSPRLDTPALENERQIIKDKSILDLINKDLINKDSENINPSIHQSDWRNDGLARNTLRNTIKSNVGYEFFKFKHDGLQNRFDDGQITLEEFEYSTSTYDLKMLDQVIEYMLDIILSINNDPIKIGDELINREVVREKLMTVGLNEMKKTITSLNTTAIKNPKKYAISMLYNS